MPDRLERAQQTLADIKETMNDIHAHATRRRAEEVEEKREDTQERRERLLDRQEETEKELERAEKLLQRLIDEGDDEESDQELRLVETIPDLEKELEQREEEISKLWQRHQREGERFRRLDELAAARARRQEKLEDRKRKVLGRIEEIKEARAEETGTGPWGGSMSIVEQEVVPVYGRHDVPVTSRKRAASHPLSISNPSSDHNEANTAAYAADGGTVAGEDVAQAAASALGISGFSTGNFTSYSITRAGKSFRVQILWGVEGHFNHVHTGVRLA